MSSKDRYIELANVTMSPSWHGDKVAKNELRLLLGTAIDALNDLDKVKKTLFYGRPYEAKHDHIDQCGQFVTNLGELPALITHVDDSPNDTIKLIHGVIGMATEAGELLEALQKAMEGNHEMDWTNLAEEVGDSFWYAAAILRVTGKTFAEVQATNTAKLTARFPHGFQEFYAENRDLDAERLVLEQPTDKQQATAERASLHQNNGKWYLHGITNDHPKLAPGAEHVGYLFESSPIVSVAYGVEGGDVVETKNTTYTIKSWDV